MFNFDKTSSNEFVSVQSDFLRLVGTPTARIIIIYHNFKGLFGIKINFLESHRTKKDL